MTICHTICFASLWIFLMFATIRVSEHKVTDRSFQYCRTGADAIVA
ncbi:Arabinose-5-phosphate isomerase [Granulibacter bethesdensis]|uniref:Arabinose-5-phosphate isomerase n=1 Tax=Granulibacter bethesdensis TaxID=364410 RepID=A0AAC9KA52_9PROT|nr:Arabinose-5-phosphate isomerase [Granulibacter bethesdensis]APH61529.1 Arabinose-5-phosphate isomerase [Granulibacter bethesdensis]